MAFSDYGNRIPIQENACELTGGTIAGGEDPCTVEVVVEDEFTHAYQVCDYVRRALCRCITCAAYDDGLCRVDAPDPKHSWPSVSPSDWCRDEYQQARPFEISEIQAALGDALSIDDDEDEEDDDEEDEDDDDLEIALEADFDEEDDD